MARTPATPEQRLHLRNKIRDAAVAVYAEQGVAGTSARAIALKAGVSVGTLYSYYSSLPDLMRSLWAEPVEEEFERLRAVVKENADPLKRIHALLNGYLSFALDRPDIFKSAFLYVRQDNIPQSPPPAAALEFHALLREAVQEGQAAGEIKPGNSAHIAQQMWAGVHGALALPVNVEGLEFGPAEEMATRMIKTLMDAIKA